jgi:cyclase
MAAEMGAGEILLTSMDKDGTHDGYDIELTKAVSSTVNVPVIASGGAGTPDHLADAVDPAGGGAEAALAASVFHFGEFSVADAKSAMAARGLPVRISRP